MTHEETMNQELTPQEQRHALVAPTEAPADRAAAHEAAPAKPSLLWMLVPVLLIGLAMFLAR